MKVVVSAEGPSLDADVCPRFGRCPYFVFVNTDDFACEPLDNSAASMGSGAGVQAAKLLFDKGVTYALTGDCGPNASEALAAAGIQIGLGYSGTVREAVEQFVKKNPVDGEDSARSGSEKRTVAQPSGNRSSIQAQPRANESSFARWGGGRGRGQGRGFGRGRGYGRGPGRGLGRGRGRIGRD